MHKPPRALTVCVIGAGVVGAATAQALSQAGHEVILLDAAAAPSSATSDQQGVLLGYAHAEPLASPNLLRALPSLWTDHDATLGIRPRASWRQWSWLVQWLRACREEPHTRAVRALLALSQLSQAEWTFREGTKQALDVATSERGRLLALTDAEHLDLAGGRVELLRDLGFQASLLKPEECLTLEPTLGSMGHRLLGGVWTASERLVNAAEMTRALIAQMQACGGRLRTLVRATGFSSSAQDHRITAVQTDSGDVLCDAAVIANGAEAGGLARRLGLYLPLATWKSHSITLPVRHRELTPAVCIQDATRRIVFAPMGDHLRVSGMLDMAGNDTRRDPHRVRMLLNAARSLFPDSCDFTADPQAWAGVQAETPDGLPLIGPTRWSNVWLNAGHGSHGVTLALGSARLVERWLAQDVNEVLAAPFVPSRR